MKQKDMFFCLCEGVKQKRPEWGARVICELVLALELPEDEIAEAVSSLIGASLEFSVPLAIIAVDTMLRNGEHSKITALNEEQGRVDNVAGISTLQSGSKGPKLVREIVLDSAFVVLLSSESTEAKQRRFGIFCDTLSRELAKEQIPLPDAEDTVRVPA